MFGFHPIKAIKEKAKAIVHKGGEFLENTGKKYGIGWLEQAGKALKNAWQKTSHDTGETSEYDQETAPEWETERIADILAGFSQGLKDQATTIESAAKTHIESYFDGLIAAIESILGRCTTTRNLRANKQFILSTIPGSLSAHLATRVSLTDAECCKILKMPKGAEKERAMGTFGRKVIREGLNNLCKQIDAALDKVSESVSGECDDLAAKQRKDLEAYNQQLKKVMDSLGRDETEQESAMLEPAQKLSASELVLDVWNHEVSA